LRLIVFKSERPAGEAGLSEQYGEERYQRRRAAGLRAVRRAVEVLRVRMLRAGLRLVAVDAMSWLLCDAAEAATEPV
jgi:hypothetical protein